MNLVFKTKEQAEAFLDKQTLLKKYDDAYSYKGIQHLNHGEYSPVEFKPQKYKDGWGIKIIHYYYPSTINAPKDRRCDSYDFID